jgi:hypothetical protein
VRLTGTHSDQFVFFHILSARRIQGIGPFVAPLFFPSIVFDCGFRKDRGKIGAELIQFSYSRKSVISSRGSSERFQDKEEKSYGNFCVEDRVRGGSSSDDSTAAGSWLPTTPCDIIQ